MGVFPPTRGVQTANMHDACTIHPRMRCWWLVSTNKTNNQQKQHGLGAGRHRRMPSIVLPTWVWVVQDIEWHLNGWCFLWTRYYLLWFHLHAEKFTFVQMSLTSGGRLWYLSKWQITSFGHLSVKYSEDFQKRDYYPKVRALYCYAKW